MVGWREGEMQDFFKDFFVFASAAVSFWWEWQWIVFPIRFFFFSLRIFPLPAKGQKRESDKKRNILGILHSGVKPAKFNAFSRKKNFFDLVTHLGSFFLHFQTGHTPLQRACAEGHLEAAKHLVSRGANVDHQDEVVRETIMIHFVHFIREIRELVYWYIISPFELLQQ